MSGTARLRRARIGTAVILWVVVTCGGMVAMNWRAASQGQSGAQPPHWPSTSELPFRPRVSNLVMFLHPMCPCSRASIDSLERLLARCGNRVNTTVVFVQPAGAEFTLADSPLVELVASLPGVSLRVDRFGRQAELFDAQTSGHVMLYDPRGRLLFSGGITIARGHNGDNDGLAAVESWISTGSARLTTAPIFGCPHTDSTTGKGEQP